nr:rust resistance kinase Lr10-like [Ipomoea batatas]
MKLLIILAILCATNCRGHQENRNCSASCGNIQDIHYPFRLTGDPNSCGLSTYELACQNNRTILNLNSHKYFVLSITYTNFSMRILDPGLQNTSSPFPLYDLKPQDLSRRYHLLRRRFNSPAAFLSCTNPANSSSYVKSEVKSEDSSFSYVLVGEHVDVGKIEDSCSVTGAAWFSTSVFPYQRHRGNMSLGQIHDALAYGFELSWLPLNCSAVCGKKHCRIEDNNTIACFRLASNSNSMPLLHKCEIFGSFLVVLVILATFGIYFLNKKRKEQLKIESVSPDSINPILQLQIFNIQAAEDECEPSSCGPTPPVIRFPFRLKGRQPDHCGYPAGFQVSCNNHNETELDLQYPARASTNNIVIPISVKAVVLEIDYKSQTMRVSIVNASCFPREVPAVNSSSWASPFESNGQYSNPYSHYIFFNCSSGSEDSGSGYSIPCLSGPGYRVYAFDSSTEATRWPLSCVKMYNISDVPYSILSPPDYVANPGESLKWSTPFCKNCEDLGKYCRLEKNSKNVTECYDPAPDKDTSGSMRKGMIAGITIGVLLISGAMDKDALSHNHSCDYDRDPPKAVSYSQAIADTHGCVTLGIKKKLGWSRSPSHS